MSRHDISYILQKLSLDHRTSLSDKACAFLQAAESNRRIKNHPSHAAICVDIAASELGIDVSREALVYISGAGGVSAYNSSRQTLSRYIILTGKSTQQEAEEEITVSGNASFPQLRLLLRKTNLGYLRQLVIRQGSMELEDIVLGCLETFFTTWTPRLPPAQQAFVKQSEAKWIAAAFWLCAMARSMSVGKDEASTIKGPANDAPKTKTIKIGGRGGKELKDAILDTVEYKVNASELDRTIRLIEIESLEYLLALRVTKIRPTGNTIQNAVNNVPSPRRCTSSRDTETPLRDGLSQVESSQTTRSPNHQPSTVETRTRLNRDAYQNMNKRTVSNISLVSDTEIEHASISSRAPPVKRSRVDTTISSAGIMGSKKSNVPTSLAESNISGTPVDNSLLLRRKTGVSTMVPRVSYKKTKAYHQFLTWQKNTLDTIVKK